MSLYETSAPTQAPPTRSARPTSRRRASATRTRAATRRSSRRSAARSPCCRTTTGASCTTTGAIDDGTGASAGEGDAYRFWRDFYDRVTSEKLDAMAREYKGLAEEATSLLAYRRAKGDMDKIADDMFFGTADDELRYRGLLQAMVDAGELPAHRAFTAESAAKRQRRQKRAAAEAAEAEEHARELGLGEAAASGGADALRTAIVARQGGR